VGPGADELLAHVQGLAWGEVEGVEPLPEPLPPPPSAARWWVGAFLVGVLAAAAGAWTLYGGGPTSGITLEASVEPGAVVFDTDDAAWVEIIALRSGRPDVVFHSDTPGDKGELATGDGRYRLSAAADAFVVLASPERLDGVDRVLGVLPPGAERPVDILVERLRERYTGAAVRGVP
ncbi:MAG: hypothetical protein ACK4YP_26360, partial [Myxococcota bacterium]